MTLNRKKFLNILLSLSGIAGLGAIFYPIFSYLIPPKISEPKVNSVKVGSASDFPNNSYKIVKFGRKPVILIKTVEGDFKALSATCTHLECIVQYKSDTHQIWCACHNGIYDLNGRNVSGPPPRPLTPYDVKIINDEIVITSAG
ncbi:ubiquinol-cytochrome c reductase iron-sulfur subunit [Melioribacteraceae bacterium 4301-Me]|uniref:QcrA and Rieske domain-containing protein n=1 Tax=Pyranulibacter aquaticus TaxID=3163344 RepID=UPI0035982094